MPYFFFQSPAFRVLFGIHFCVHVFFIWSGRWSLSGYYLIPSKHKGASWLVFGLRKSWWKSNTWSSSWELLDASHCAAVPIIHRPALIHWRCFRREALTWHRYLWEFWALTPITWNGGSFYWDRSGFESWFFKWPAVPLRKNVFFYLLKKKRCG